MTTAQLNGDVRRHGLATVQQACDFLEVGRTTLYAMIRDNELAATKIRNAKRIPWQALYEIADAAMQTEGGAV